MELDITFDESMEDLKRQNEILRLDNEFLAKCIEYWQKENETLRSQLDFIGEQNKYIEKLERKLKEYDGRRN